MVSEIFGTFLLVFVGCGAIALTLVYEVFEHLWQIALCWGGIVSISILLLHRWGPVHLNPAVSCYFWLQGQINKKHFLALIGGHMIGAAIATWVLYQSIAIDLALFESAQQIDRSSLEGIQSAMIFTEFYPNPGGNLEQVSTFEAFVAEMIGTFFLLLVITLLSKTHFQIWVKALLIGLTLSLLIFTLASYTQAGFNPVRDLIPRIILPFLGWTSAAWSAGIAGSLLVYVAGPLSASTLLWIIMNSVEKRKGTSSHG